jgi:hypothetical protein
VIVTIGQGMYTTESALKWLRTSNDGQERLEHLRQKETA